MNSNYQIIKDKESFLKFIDWLPECAENEQYYLALLARRKYEQGTPHITSDKAQLVRKTASKEFLYQKVKQMECEVGSYQLKGVTIPQEAIALYISINPRDLWKANLKTVKRLISNIENNCKTANPQADAMSEIQKSAGNRKYILFDIDSKDEDILNNALDICQRRCDVIETRGGYHVLVKKDEVESLDKHWYQKLAAISDVSGDEMSPVVGCTQGNFIPRLIQFTA